MGLFSSVLYVFSGLRFVSAFVFHWAPGNRSWDEICKPMANLSVQFHPLTFSSFSSVYRLSRPSSSSKGPPRLTLSNNHASGLLLMTNTFLPSSHCYSRGVSTSFWCFPSAVEPSVWWQCNMILAKARYSWGTRAETGWMPQVGSGWVSLPNKKQNLQKSFGFQGFWCFTIKDKEWWVLTPPLHHCCDSQCCTTKTSFGEGMRMMKKWPSKWQLQRLDKQWEGSWNMLIVNSQTKSKYTFLIIKQT